MLTNDRFFHRTIMLFVYLYQSVCVCVTVINEFPKFKKLALDANFKILEQHLSSESGKSLKS